MVVFLVGTGIGLSIGIVGTLYYLVRKHKVTV